MDYKKFSRKLDHIQLNIYTSGIFGCRGTLVYLTYLVCTLRISRFYIQTSTIPKLQLPKTYMILFVIVSPGILNVQLRRFDIEKNCIF